ncbi:MAG: 16S rRNA (uracil(1498)-N(3))-methyltransferase [Deltaproteobacteria bacterium]|nr:16S rRNA (uracil(1498)-N(3))-methyltransferase [Deltaproteobacteria bacterium]MCL5277570.1 16S rRNA (uracil(1498)-N(3))-methyltransferase [Deltaproteobacteria bacterium]
MPQLLISENDVRGHYIVITGPGYKHVRSLRIRIGEEFLFRDESGNGYTGVLKRLTRYSAVFEISGRLSATNSRSGIVLAPSIIKREGMLVAIKKATELGVDAIIPVVSRYTIVKLKNTNFKSKYRAVIKEAVGQCMRPDIPRLYEPTTYEGLFDMAGDACKLLFHVGAGAGQVSAFLREIQQAGKVVLIIGPEGGFSNDEIEVARDHGAHIVGLGSNILRSETAAAAAVSIVSFVREQSKVKKNSGAEGATQ